MLSSKYLVVVGVSIALLFQPSIVSANTLCDYAKGAIADNKMELCLQREFLLALNEPVTVLANSSTVQAKNADAPIAKKKRSALSRVAPFLVGLYTYYRGKNAENPYTRRWGKGLGIGLVIFAGIP